MFAELGEDYLEDLLLFSPLHMHSSSQLHARLEVGREKRIGHRHPRSSRLYSYWMS